MHTNILNIVFCEERNSLNEEYKSLKLISIDISTLKLKLDLEKMSYKENLKINFNSFNKKNVAVNISITLRQNFKVILFGVALVVLLILEGLLLVLIFIVKIKNKDLKNELDSMEIDMMSERGIEIGDEIDNGDENEDVIREE